jgi:phosphatidylinositol glycan class U
LLTFTLIALTAIFKSYPSYGDVGFYMALLPTMGYLFPYMKQSFIVANMLVATTMLGPILYQLWIYNGSANANYFFAITLVYGTAQIFLVTDILFAHVKREFYLKSGFKALKPTKNGPMIQLT